MDKYRITPEGIRYVVGMVKRDPKTAKFLAEMIVQGFLKNVEEKGLVEALIWFYKGCSRLSEDGIDIEDLLELLVQEK